ncbi:9289_t:CDS:2 [Diversispora eburnea]|uniref:9289_t:CDS:1 n=1 Tax=Diversispora eburnea TaxID=1213867 RepID=A0A9N9BF35_9GLOM|nr:9289_t:CDS:2 [Diversispora eburnea]
MSNLSTDSSAEFGKRVTNQPVFARPIITNDINKIKNTVVYSQPNDTEVLSQLHNVIRFLKKKVDVSNIPIYGVIVKEEDEGDEDEEGEGGEEGEEGEENDDDPKDDHKSFLTLLSFLF